MASGQQTSSDALPSTPPGQPLAPVASEAAQGAPLEPASPAPREGETQPLAPGVIVLGLRSEPSRSASLSRAEVRQIPGAFGDPFRAIEVLPGVTPIVSGLPFFFVRGAPPGNVGYFLDGIRVPLLYHVGVGPSVVHPGIIERVDLYPGGYPARFGRFAGGVVAGEVSEPRGELHGEGNIRLFDAGALVEAPIAKGRGSVLVGGRYSYTAALLSLAAPDASLQYWDYQGRVSYDLTERDRVSVFSFGSYDYLGERSGKTTKTVFGTQFHRLDLRYDHLFAQGQGSARLAVLLGVDSTELDEQRHLRDRLIGVRSELRYRISERAELRAGTDANLDVYDVQSTSVGWDGRESRDEMLDQFSSRRDVSVGARADVVLSLSPRFEVTPGLRIDAYGSQGRVALGVDPRLSTRLLLTPHARLLTAIGVAHQLPSFVVPVPGFQPGGIQGGLQRAIQESAGVEVDVASGTTFSATAFHNTFFGLSDPLSLTSPSSSGCEAVTPAPGGDDALSSQASRRCGSDEGDERGSTGLLNVRSMGSSYGLELMLKRRLTSKLAGFASYTLSRSTRSYGRRRFIAAFDRTHVLNAAVAYALGRGWRAGTRLMFYTGLPDASSAGASRLPSFYRVDLRLEKRWPLAEMAWVSFVVEGMNITLRKETVATSCALDGCSSEDIGPISIPSLGVEGAFLRRRL